MATLYREESRRVYSTLVRLLGSFDAAEEALQDAFVAAAEQWPGQGVPAKPVAWFVSTGRFKGIDRIRRDKRLVGWEDAADQADAVADDAPGWEQLVDERHAIEDDRLRLVFTSRHPSLAEESRIAWTLRAVCGLTTEAIAGAFLIATPTLAQRTVRAKAKIAAARIPCEVPGLAERPARLASVLRVVCLVFNEGHAAHAADLAGEAIRLARLLRALMPAEPEVAGLLALLLLHDAHHAARVSAEGALVPLEEQDRALWNRGAVDEGCALTEQALSHHGFGAYALQAAIAALHGEAASTAATDWPQIVGLYDVLFRIEPSPEIALNRAVAIAMRDGPEAGLALIESLLPALPGYHAAVAAAADLCRRADRLADARSSYRSAAALARQEPEQQALGAKIETMMSCADMPAPPASDADADAGCGDGPRPTGDGILHACLKLPGGAMLFAGDTPPGVPYEGVKGVMLAIQYDSVDHAHGAFAALSQGGQVTMPLMPAFWSKTFGMLTDRFGVSWAVNGEPIALPAALSSTSAWSSSLPRTGMRAATRFAPSTRKRSTAAADCWRPSRCTARTPPPRCVFEMAR